MKDIPTADTIQLTRIHALYWYGFSDSFDLVGHTLVTGVYGCGKTALIDLIQTVLLGPPDHDSRYNLSVGEVGTTSREVKRDLRGYALQDLNVMHEGSRVFARPCTRTYIALEWTWPALRKRETWGIRIEFASTGSDAEFEFWHVPGRLDFDDFATEATDGDRLPLDAEGWLKKIADEGGQRYATKDLYLEAIAAPQHLHFDAQVFKPLLMQTLRFSFGRDFNEFCRNHILPESRIDIEVVRDSYDRYRDFLGRIRLLEEQQQQLEKICTAFTDYHRLDGEIAALGWFQQSLRLEEKLRAFQTAAAEFESVRAASAKWDADLKTLKAQRTALEDEKKAIDRTLAELPNAQEFGHFKTRQTALPAEIEQSTQRLEKPADVLRQQCDRLHTLSRQASALAARQKWAATPLPPDCPIEVPPGSDANAIEHLARQLESAAETAAESWKDIAKLADAEKGTVENREVAIRRDLARLNENRGTENLILREALERKLGRQNVQLIGDLCEVTDEAWADALEINFVHKLTSLVPDTSVGEGFQILNSLPEINPRERLACRADIMKLSDRVATGSLAEKITSDDPAVQRLLAHLFGGVQCCDSVAQAEKHPHAVLRSGAIKEPTGRRRPRTSPSEYAIGRKGREKMIARREADLAALTGPLETVRRLARETAQLRDGLLHVKTTLVTLRRDKVSILRELEQLRAEQIQVNDKLELLPNRVALEAKRKDSRRKAEEIAGLSVKILNLVENPPPLRTQKEQELNTARDAHATAETDALAWQAAHPEAVALAAKHQALESEARNRATKDRPGSLACEAMIGSRREERATVRGDLLRIRQQLHDHPRIPDFRDFDVEDVTDNSLWEKKLNYIVETGLKDFTHKMEAAELEWEERFQKNILGQLFEQLGAIRQTFRGLQRLIAGRTIGGARYGFAYNQSDRGDFNMLRDLAVNLELHGGFAPGSKEAIDVRNRRREAMKLFETGAKPDPRAPARQQELLDPRYYFTYDMEITEAGRTEPVSLNARGRKGSGGETYNPYLIALMTAYMRAFNRHENSTRPSISLLLMDEAFKVNDTAAVRDCVNIIAQLGLQGVISCTNTVGSQVIDCFQWAMIVQKQVEAASDGAIHDRITNSVYAAPKNDPEVLRIIGDDPP